MLKENLNISANSPIEVRQPPVNGDDDDSWANSDEDGAFDYLAQQIIEAINSDDTEPILDNEDGEL